MLSLTKHTSQRATPADGKPAPAAPVSKEEPAKQAKGQATDAGEFKESDHPRKDNGEFGKGGGSVSNGGSEGDEGGGGKPHAVELTGKELGYWGTTKELRKAAMEYAKQHFVGKPSITNVNSQHPIKITWQGVKHSLAKANATEVKLMAGLPQILKNAKYLGASPDKLGRPHIKTAHRYMAVANVGGETLQVGIITHEKHDGHEHYDHFIVSQK